MLSILIETQLKCSVRTSRLKHLKRIKPNRRYNIGKVRVNLVCGEEMRVLERSSRPRRGTMATSSLGISKVTATAVAMGRPPMVTVKVMEGWKESSKEISRSLEVEVEGPG